MSPEQLDHFVKKYIDGTATPDERELLNAWFRSEQGKAFAWYADYPDEEIRLREELLHGIHQQIKLKKPLPRIIKWTSIAAAAIVLLLTGLLLLQPSLKGPHKHVKEIVKHDALPGTSGAVLTVAGGQTIELGKQAAVAAIQQENYIKGVSDSSLVYQTQPGKADLAATWNTLTVPNGNQFSVVLPDGTKVWMNAGSSLYYPTRFTGKERRVRLTGEAYFEVVHNTQAPFYVEVNGHTVTDLGTSFNINNYADESSITVTLAEGSASVHNKAGKVLLQPGQQAVINNKNNQIQVSEADMETAIAWKSGLFHFNHVKLDVALRQIARWYNLEIIYTGAIPELFIDGEIYRDVKASQLFDILKQLRVRFTIEENKLIVSGSNT